MTICSNCGKPCATIPFDCGDDETLSHIGRGHRHVEHEVSECCEADLIEINEEE